MSTIRHALNVGWQHQQAGRLAQAEQVYRHILQDDPQQADALYLLGIVGLRQGKFDQAAAALHQFLDLQPGHAEAHSNLAVALAGQQRLAEAVKHFRQSLEIDPTNADAHSNLGLARLQQNQPQEAIADFQHALRLRPDHADAQNHLGLAYLQLRRFDEAVACWRELVRQYPREPEGYHRLGIALTQQGKAGEAVTCLRHAVELNPRHPDALNHLGLALAEQEHLEQAVACFRQSLRLRGDYPDAQNNLGLALAELGQLDEAVTTLQAALRVQPHFAKAHNNLGLARIKQGRVDEAVAAYTRAIELEPDYPEAHRNRALAWLTQADFARGWPEYEWRWRCPEFKQRSFRAPRWDGSPLDGRTILIYAEQGLGDMLQFVRYLPLLKQRGATVWFECPTALLRLLEGLAGVDRLLKPMTAPEEYDVQAPLMSLPGLFGTDLTSIPADIPYLHADPQLVEAWRQELAPIREFKVGIAWHGNPKARTGKHRSFSLAQFAALARIEGVRLFSLQKGAGVEQLHEAMDRFTVIDFGNRLDEEHGPFMDSAAVMKNLDLVITLDTSLAHLAGGLGVPVWVALPFYADWRWLRDREETPWYPTMRLFRQAKPDDWEGVFARLEDALRKHLDRPVQLPPLPKLGNKLSRCRYGTMLYPPRDHFIGRSLELYGEFSEAEVALFRQLIRPGQTVVDVGANVGTHTLPLAQLVGADGRVLAFEPQRWLYYCLCANVALNDLTNVVCHEAAIGESRGSLVVPELDYAAGGNYGGLELGDVNPGGWSYTVPLERIDDLKLTQCHFIKIDVEGMEKQVLAGAVETIRRFQPLLYVEDDRREKSAELRAFLQSLGYQLFLHGPPLFNPNNFLGRRDNVFGTLISLNLFCQPPGRPLAIDPHEFSMRKVG